MAPEEGGSVSEDESEEAGTTLPGPVIETFEVRSVAYDPGGYEHDFVVVSLSDTSDLLACALAADLELEPGPGASQLAIFAYPSFLWAGCPEGLTVLDCDPAEPCGWFRRWDDAGLLEVDLPVVQGLVRGALSTYGNVCDMTVELQFANDETFETDLSVVTDEGPPPWCLQ